MSVQSDYSDIESVGNAVSYGDRLPEEDADYDHLMVEYVVPTPKLTHPSAKRQRVLGTETLAPVTILVASTIGCCKLQRILKVLCDSGSVLRLDSGAWPSDLWVGQGRLSVAYCPLSS